jgi:hypothetical protein
MGREDKKTTVRAEMMQKRKGRGRQKTITLLVAVSVLGGARVGNDPLSLTIRTLMTRGARRQYEEFIC